MENEDKQVSLAELNAQLFRSVHPQTFGNEEEQAAGKKAEAGKEAAELKKIKDERALRDSIANGMLARHHAEMQAAQGVERAISAEEQEALDALKAMEAAPTPPVTPAPKGK